MFSNLILKSVIVDNIIILIPENVKDNDLLILISHGSGGIGKAEYNAANFFLKNGYKVGLIDYFSKHNIKNLWWNYDPNFKDSHSVSFKNMLTDIKLPDDLKIIHIGFSLGGFFGILNSESFYKNYCFYPGIIGFTKSIIEKNYSNTTVFTAKKDNWCNYNMFKTNCKLPPKEIEINAYHGFMIPKKRKKIPVAIYKIPSNAISEDEFNLLKPCHDFLEKQYGYEPRKIRLQYDKNSCIMCLNKILEDIK